MAKRSSAFTRVWARQSDTGRRSIVTTAVQLLSSRLGQAGESHMRMLCPELALDNLERLSKQQVVPQLLEVRANNADECRQHDITFVASRAGSTAITEEIRRFADLRTRL